MLSLTLSVSMLEVEIDSLIMANLPKTLCHEAYCTAVALYNFSVVLLVLASGDMISARRKCLVLQSEIYCVVLGGVPHKSAMKIGV